MIKIIQNSNRLEFKQQEKHTKVFINDAFFVDIEKGTEENFTNSLENLLRTYKPYKNEGNLEKDS